MNRVILTHDDLDGLLAGLTLREAIGDAEIRICGDREDLLQDRLAEIPDADPVEVWITCLAPTEESRPFINYHQMRLINGQGWMYWLDHHRWPFQKKQWFRQISKVKTINDHRRRSFEICAGSCLPVPHTPEVLALCAAGYHLRADARPEIDALWAKLRSLAGDTPEAHRDAEQWMAAFRPGAVELATLDAPAAFAPVALPEDRIEVVEGAGGTKVVRIDLTDGAVKTIGRGHRRELLVEAQRRYGATGAVLLLPDRRATIAATQFRLPEGARKVVDELADAIVDSKGNPQFQAVRVADDDALSRLAPALAAIEPETATGHDPGTPAAMYAEGMAAFHEGRIDEARIKLGGSIESYLAVQDWESEAIPRVLQPIPPWPLRAETALWMLGD